jgi:hypothetical protein
MMAQAVPNPPNEKKRVKVYELRNNDWFDRGTGFCTAAFLFVCLLCSAAQSWVGARDSLSMLAHL